MNRKLTTTILLATSVLVLGACGGEEEEVEPLQEDTGTVVVNNGEVETEGEVVPEREVYGDEVPSVTRKKINKESITSEIPYGEYEEDTPPDLSEEEVKINGGIPETTNFSTPYTLYFKDGEGRSVGGEGVVTYMTLGEISQDIVETETELYELELLSTGLLKEERGLEERNKVKVTKQAYNRINELNREIYEEIDPSNMENEVYIKVEAIYDGDNKIPYGVHYQAQSTYGDVKFNYIINNIQNGYEVDYNKGTVKAGGLVE